MGAKSEPNVKEGCETLSQELRRLCAQKKSGAASSVDERFQNLS